MPCATPSCNSLRYSSLSSTFYLHRVPSSLAAAGRSCLCRKVGRRKYLAKRSLFNGKRICLEIYEIPLLAMLPFFPMLAESNLRVLSPQLKTRPFGAEKHEREWKGPTYPPPSLPPAGQHLYILPPSLSLSPHMPFPIMSAT